MKDGKKLILVADDDREIRDVLSLLPTEVSLIGGFANALLI